MTSKLSEVVVQTFDVSFDDFLKTGAFGPIRVGDSRFSFDHLLDEPSSAAFTNKQRTAVIWKFGQVEFHIESDRLRCIRSVADDFFNGGPTLRIQSSKLRPGMRQKEVELILKGRSIDFQFIVDNVEQQAGLQLGCGVYLRICNDVLCGWAIGSRLD